MDYTKKNREFAESYEPKNDGSLADRLAIGLKKHFTDAKTNPITPEERRDYKRKMKQIIKNAVSSTDN